MIYGKSQLKYEKYTKTITKNSTPCNKYGIWNKNLQFLAFPYQKMYLKVYISHENSFFIFCP